MTPVELIKETMEALPVRGQRKALAFVRGLKPRKVQRKRVRAKRRVEGTEKYRAKDAAVRGIAGMWKDRTDLPKDPVEAVKVLRDRVMQRGGELRGR